jgi:uncharacterized protein involved in outer membrane biogenesis
MSVAKIFKILIVVVACVIVGALVLNVLLPNTTKSLVNSVEDQIYNATGMTFDLNGDGDYGTKSSSTTKYTGNSTTTSTKQSVDQSANVNGYK